MEVESEARALDNNQNMVRSVSHALQCREANCGQPSCMKMKRVMAHTKLCKRKTYGSCHICLELITHCKYHANNCILTKCPVPFCSKMKIKQQRLQQVQLLQNPQSVAMVKPLYMSYQPGIGVTPGSKTFVNQGPVGTSKEQGSYGRGLALLAPPCTISQKQSSDNLLLIVKWNPKHQISVIVGFILILIFVAMLKFIVFF